MAKRLGNDECVELIQQSVHRSKKLLYIDIEWNLTSKWVCIVNIYDCLNLFMYRYF